MAIKQLDLEPIAGQMEHRQSGPMELLQIALQNNAAIDVIERLAALQEKALARDAEVQFNEAMNAVQAELGRIAPDLTNPQTHSKYASYAALDRVLRPIYVRHGFSLSFDSGESSPETVRAYCYVSHRAGHTRRYQSPDMPADGKGAKGGDVMTKTHATGSAMSYAMRYLLKYIFNVAIGADDNDGNGQAEIDSGWASERDERLAFFPRCSTMQELQDHWKASYEEAKKHKDTQAVDAFNFAKNKRKTELAGAK